jgi:Glycine zipper
VADMNLNITGSAAGALAALRATQAAIDALHGKSVDVTVNVHGSDKAAGDLGKVGKARRAASGRTKVDADASGVRGARDDLRDMAEEARRAGREASRAAKESRPKTREGDGDEASRRAAGDIESATRAMRELESGAGGMRSIESGAIGAARSMRQLESGTGSAARSMREVGAGTDLVPHLRDVGSAAASSEVEMRDFGDGVYRVADGSDSAARSMRALEAGTRVGAGLERASTGAESFVEGTRRASAAADDGFLHIDAVGRVMRGTGADALGAGRSMLAIESGARGLDTIAPMLKQSAVEGVGMASALGGAGTVLGVVARAALISTGVMTGLTAATAAAGFGASFVEMRRVPGMMTAAREATDKFDVGLAAVRNQASAGAIPAMRGLGAQLKDLGKEFGSIGAANLTSGIGDVATLASDATHTLAQLAPVIRPAETAITALGGAVMGAIGDSAPQIGRFANSLTQAAPGLQSVGTSAIQAMSTIGSVAVKTVAGLAPIAQAFADTVGAVSDFGGGMIGVASNYTTPPGVDGSTSDKPSTWNRAGSVTVGALAGARLGAGIGSFIEPVGGTAVGAAVGGLGGALLGWHHSDQKVDTSGAAGNDPFTGEPITGEPATTASGAHAQLYPLAPGSPGTPGHPALPASGGGFTPDTPGDTHGAVQRPGGALYFDPSTQRVSGSILTDPTASGFPVGSSAPPGTGTGSAAQAPAAGSRTASRPEEARRSVDVMRGVGRSGGLPGGFAGQQIEQAMRQIGTATDAATASQSRLGQQSQSSLGQMSTASRGAGQSVQEGLTRPIQAAPQAMAASAAQIPKAVTAQVPPQALATPMHQAVAQATASAAPAAASGGASVGAAMTSGMGAGVTKTETSTLTIVHKWITKVIDEAAGALGAHSPSTAFIALGASAPEGLGIGIASGAGASISAVKSLVQGVIAQAGTQLQAGGAQLSGAHGTLAKALTPPKPPAPSQPPETGAWQRNYPRAVADQRARQDPDHPLSDTQTRNNAIGQERDENWNRIVTQRDRNHDAALALSRYGAMDPSQVPAGQTTQQALQDEWATRQPAKSWTGQVARMDQASQPAPPPAPPGPSIPGVPSNVSDAMSNAMRTQGTQNGQAAIQGVVQGLNQGQSQVNQAGSSMAGGLGDTVKKKLGVSSPSQVFSDIGANAATGMSGGMGSALSNASDGVHSVASNTGLMVGYVWAQSVVSGALSVMRSADFQTTAVTGVGSALAETALGAAGMLGPAGSGAQTYKLGTGEITMGGGSAAQAPTPHIQLTINMDGQRFRQYTAEQINSAMDQLTNSLGLQPTS